jgi:hypothetical protein
MSVKLGPPIVGEHRLRVFANMTLRKIFSLKRDMVTRESRQQHYQELYDLYCSPNVTQMMKSRRKRWAMYMACMEVHTRLWWGDLKETYHLEDLGVDGRIKLKWIFKKWHGKAWDGLICLRICNEPLDSIKCREFLD